MSREDSRTILERVTDANWSPKIRTTELTPVEREIERLEAEAKEERINRLPERERTLARLKQHQASLDDASEAEAARLAHLEAVAPELEKLNQLRSLYEADETVDKRHLVRLGQAIDQVSTPNGDKLATNQMLTEVYTAENERQEVLAKNYEARVASAQAQLDALQSQRIRYEVAPEQVRIPLESQSLREQGEELFKKLADSTDHNWATMDETYTALRALRSGDELAMRDVISRIGIVVEPQPAESEVTSDSDPS